MKRYALGLLSLAMLLMSVSPFQVIHVEKAPEQARVPVPTTAQWQAAFQKRQCLGMKKESCLLSLPGGCLYSVAQQYKGRMMQVVRITQELSSHLVCPAVPSLSIFLPTIAKPLASL